MTRTPLSMLPTNPTTQAVRCSKHCMSAIGSDTDELNIEAWERWSKRVDFFVSLPGFDRAEYNRLCRLYGVH